MVDEDNCWYVVGMLNHRLPLLTRSVPVLGIDIQLSKQPMASFTCIDYSVCRIPIHSKTQAVSDLVVPCLWPVRYLL